MIVDVSKKVLTDNVKFRTAPSTSVKTQLVWLYDEMYNVSVESVKKGTVITTRARTTKLEEYDENKNSEYSKILSAELKR